MSDFTEDVKTNLSALNYLLGEGNVEDVKKRIADLVVNAVADDIKHYQKQNYIFYPPDYIKGIAEEAFEEVEKKIKKLYKDAMLDIAKRSVERFKDMAIDDLQTDDEK